MAQCIGGGESEALWVESNWFWGWYGRVGDLTASRGGFKATACLSDARGVLQVYLSNSETGEKLVYAVSWWSKAEMDKYMKEMDAPIWVNLQVTTPPLGLDAAVKPLLSRSTTGEIIA
eukprot:6141881-Pyramimonas_sp.AAC.1